MLHRRLDSTRGERVALLTRTERRPGSVKRLTSASARLMDPVVISRHLVAWIRDGMVQRLAAITGK
jgi:hypothetical protein